MIDKSWYLHVWAIIKETDIPGHQLQMKCADPLSFRPYGLHNDAD